MKICVAQTRSRKGDFRKNIENHLELITRAIDLKSDIILFPELSITNYEPEMASVLVKDMDDEIFRPFQILSDKNKIIIGVGVPTKSNDGIHISTLVFQPLKEKIVYSKQMLHSDETPYFVCGNDQIILDVHSIKIGLGICYESLQPQHFLNAKDQGIDIYIASVAKSNKGIENACKYFSRIADEFDTPILMSNSVGPCDSFLSGGQSAVWNVEGERIAQLGDTMQGLLVYDTKSQKVEVEQ